jgi:hypothetical protein
LIARLGALGYSGCGECPGAFEPNSIACSAIELEKRISIAACAVTEIGTLGEQTCFPTPANQQNSRNLNGASANVVTMPGAPWQCWQ